MTTPLKPKRKKEPFLSTTQNNIIEFPKNKVKRLLLCRVSFNSTGPPLSVPSQSVQAMPMNYYKLSFSNLLFLNGSFSPSFQFFLLTLIFSLWFSLSHLVADEKSPFDRILIENAPFTKIEINHSQYNYLQLITFSFRFYCCDDENLLFPYFFSFLFFASVAFFLWCSLPSSLVNIVVVAGHQATAISVERER